MPIDNDIAIEVQGVSKAYRIWRDPAARLKFPLIQALGNILPEALRPQKLRRQEDSHNIRYYKDFYALKDINFFVKKGESVGIVGRNGSGKSTLLQIIAGTLTPTSGIINVKGRVAALLELGSGFNPEFTGRENVYLNASILGLAQKEIDARFDEIAAFAEIGEFIDQPVKTYSSGMVVRLAFAVIAHVEADVLIVDEALAVGDVRFQIKCHRKFSEFKERGRTIFLVSHSTADIMRLCDRAIWIDRGKFRLSGAPVAVTEQYLADLVHDAGTLSAQPASGTPKTNAIDASTLMPLPENSCITGDGGAIIQGVAMLSESNANLKILNGPTRVKIKVQALANVDIENPFIAFQIINSKGIRVMGCNTFVLGKKIPRIRSGERFLTDFSLHFPEIENGQYVIAFGVNDGTPEKHIRHAFVADAYVFEMVSSSVYQTQAVLLKLPDCLATTTTL